MTEFTARASVPTEMAGRYIAQLCKHFAHRIPAESDAPDSKATRGRIEFPDAGVCTLWTEPMSLEMELTAKDSETLERLQDVVTKHLARFAWREPPTVTWE
jgi:uncharacterized protein